MLGLVFVLALAVRLWGTTWQLPAVLYFDELKYVQWAYDKADGRRLGAPDYRNPTLFKHVLALELQVAQSVWPEPDASDRAVRGMAIARVSTAVMGALTAVCIAVAALALAGRGAALVSGLLLALSPLHVHLSHLAVNDVPASLLLAAGLSASVYFLLRPRFRLATLAGVLAGLATAAKYNYGVVLLVPLTGLAFHAALGGWGMLCHLVTGAPRPAARVREPGLLATVLVLAFALGAGIGMPELITDARGVASGLVEQARIGETASDDQEPTPVSVLYLETVARGLGPAGALLALAGAGLLVWQRPGLAPPLLVAPAAYLAVMLRGELFAARFALPLVMFGALLAGVGVGLWRVRSGSWEVNRPSWARHLITRATFHFPLALVALLLFAPLVRDIVQHNRLATTADTRVLAEQWLREHAQGEQAAVQAYSLPVEWPGSDDINGVRVSRFQSLLDPSAFRRLECDGVDYVLLSSFNYERQLRGLPNPNADTGYRRLRERAERVALFTPFTDGNTAPAHPDDTAIPYWYMHAYQQPGPIIEIYRMPDGGCRR